MNSLANFSDYSRYNKQLLGDYSNRLTGQSNQLNEVVKKPSLVARSVNYIFPNKERFGQAVGENLGITYGAQACDAAIGMALNRLYPQPLQPASFLDRFTNLITGAAKTSATTATKVYLVPKIMPYLVLLAGTTGSLTASALIMGAVSIYQKYGHQPNKLAQLKSLPLDQWFKQDPETGDLHDVFGNRLYEKDIKQEAYNFSKSHVIAQLIQLCEKVDAIEKTTFGLEGKELRQQREAKQKEEMKKVFSDYVASYQIKREDGQLLFMDGTLVTPEKEELIKTAIKKLTSLNKTAESEDIINFIQLMGKASLPPVRRLALADQAEVEKTKPKSMPEIFLDKENEWINAVILTEDGKYVLKKDIEAEDGTVVKAKGTIISNEEMIPIFNQLLKFEEGLRTQLSSYEIKDDYFNDELFEKSKEENINKLVDQFQIVDITAQTETEKAQPIIESANDSKESTSFNSLKTYLPSFQIGNKLSNLSQTVTNTTQKFFQYFLPAGKKQSEEEIELVKRNSQADIYANSTEIFN